MGGATWTARKCGPTGEGGNYDLSLPPPVNDGDRAVCGCHGRGDDTRLPHRATSWEPCVSSDVRGDWYARQLGSRWDKRAACNINPNILAANYSLPKLLWMKTMTLRFSMGMEIPALDGPDFLSFSAAGGDRLFPQPYPV